LALIAYIVVNPTTSKSPESVNGRTDNSMSKKKKDKKDIQNIRIKPKIE
jgi:hypothetical protein